MSTSTLVLCDACRQPPFPAEGTGAELPRGWYVRRIAGKAFTLCDCCGDIRHFKGGVSLYLQENLGVGAGAQCEFADVPGSGLHRTRLASKPRA